MDLDQYLGQQEAWDGWVDWCERQGLDPYDPDVQAHAEEAAEAAMEDAAEARAEARAERRNAEW